MAKYKKGQNKSSNPSGFKPHPDYLPGSVPTKGNRVRDIGLTGNFNAPTRGEMNKKGTRYPGSVRK